MVYNKLEEEIIKIDSLQFKDLYKELIDCVPEKMKNNLCVFFPQVGKNYLNLDDKILFIGKSVNGWNKLDDIEILFDEKNINRIVNRDDQIYWVEKNNIKDYNTNNSAFWRLIKNITKKYFAGKREIETTYLNGSVELAPLVGLSEVIVDIVESGKTLEENGLTVLEEICDVSARFVVNRVSMKMKRDRILDLVEKINKELEKGESR